MKQGALLRPVSPQEEEHGRGRADDLLMKGFVMRYVIVDLEATCWEKGTSPDKMEIIENAPGDYY